MGKAIFGALMGVGQGVSQYGQLLARDVIAKQHAKEEFDRQTSLLEIRDRYERDRLKDELNPMSEIGSLREAKRLRELNEQYDPADPIYQKREAERIRLAKESIDPTTEVGGLMEAKAEREHKRQVELRQAYGYGTSTGLGTYNPSNYSDETNQEIMTIYSSNIDAGMSEKDALIDAQRQVGVAGNLKSKPSSVGQDLGVEIEKRILGDMQDANKMSATDLAYLLSEDNPERLAELENKPKSELLKMYRQTLRTDVYPRPPGLMNSASSSGAGSSRDNPVDATQFTSSPPTGTWVRLPDGRVVQVP